MKTQREVALALIAVIALGLVCGGVYWAIQNNYFEQVVSMIDKGMAPGLFIVLMVLLPLIGFPISVFLIMGGIKFGILYAILLWALTLPLHTLFCFFLARALRKPLLRIITGRMGYDVPEVSEKHEALFSFVFLAVPGIPYAVKNYLLPLAGIPFRYCVLMNAVVQLILGIPFIVLGKSAADMNWTLLFIAAGFFLVGTVSVWWLEKRYGDQISGGASADHQAMESPDNDVSFLKEPIIMKTTENAAKLARAGYLTRGIVYMIVGWMAVQAAIAGGNPGKTTGAKGALLEVLGEPFGQIMLGLLIIGLIGYALWRSFQAVFDADNHGTGAKGIAVRGGLLVSAVSHTLLAIFAIGLITGWGTDVSNGKDWTAELLGTGWGRWVVAIIGLAVIGAGLAQGYKAAKRKYKERLQIDDQKMRWISPVCIFGLFARGFVFVIIGIFFVLSALHLNPGHAKGMKGALIALQGQPYGGVLFLIVAFGLVAFALYSLVEARYRRISSARFGGNF